MKRSGGQGGLDYGGHAPEFGRRHPERRGITVLLEVYDGFSPFGQFYRDDVTAYGLAVQFDF